MVVPMRGRGVGEDDAAFHKKRGGKEGSDIICRLGKDRSR